MSITLERRSFTTDEFLRMYETGILSEEQRLELLDGEILVMSPIGPLHASLVNQIAAMFHAQLAGRFVVSVQNPVRLSGSSFVQPDLAALRLREDHYRSAIPEAADVLLIVEVADTSVSFDRDDKLPRYAAAGIPEVWLVLGNQRMAEQHFDPAEGTYRQTRRAPSNETVVSRMVRDLILELPKLFP